MPDAPLLAFLLLLYVIDHPTACHASLFQPWDILTEVSFPCSTGPCAMCKGHKHQREDNVAVREQPCSGDHPWGG